MLHCACVLCVMDVESCSVTCLNSQRLFPCGVHKTILELIEAVCTEVYMTTKQ